MVSSEFKNSTNSKKPLPLEQIRKICAEKGLNASETETTVLWTKLQADGKTMPLTYVAKARRLNERTIRRHQAKALAAGVLAKGEITHSRRPNGQWKTDPRQRLVLIHRRSEKDWTQIRIWNEIRHRKDQQYQLAQFRKQPQLPLRQDPDIYVRDHQNKISNLSFEAVTGTLVDTKNWFLAERERRRADEIAARQTKCTSSSTQNGA